MKIVILTNGTRGDIQPLIYLGEALGVKGHNVTITASDNFSPVIESAGLIHKSMPVNLQEYLETDEGRLWMKKISRNPFALLSEIRKMVPRLALSTLDAYWEACRGTDLIITTTGALGDIYFRNKLHVPLVEVQLQPLEPTGDFAYPLIKLPVTGRFINKLSYYYFEWFLGRMFRKSLKKWQKNTFSSVIRYKGGPFAERRRTEELKLGAFSPSLIQKPSDWPENYHICGNFFPASENDYTRDRKIEEFISSGTRPVYVGFGSMAVSNPEILQKIIRQIIERTEVRIILFRGWSSFSLEEIPRRLLIIDSVSHTWLFPKMSGIIHHGGAGTTGAALKAGIPQMIFPKTADQPFWAGKVHLLGISPKPERLENLSVEMFERIFNFFSTESVKKKAAEMGLRISGENGIDHAVELIEKLYKETTIG